jgi:ParB-like chromosome segregation protein Spo0J
MAAVIPHRYEQRNVDQLEPHPDNPNRGDPDAVGESIESIGFFGVVLVQESTGRILAGEHRWRAAQAHGIPALPVIAVDCDDETARKILLADNHFARLAVWDEDALTALLATMAADDGGLAGSGFNGDDLAVLLARQAEGLPEGFRHLVPGETGGDGHHGDDAGMVTCPNCGHEFAPGGEP